MARSKKFKVAPLDEFFIPDYAKIMQTVIDSKPHWDYRPLHLGNEVMTHLRHVVDIGNESRLPIKVLDGLYSLTFEVDGQAFSLEIKTIKGRKRRPPRVKTRIS